jgi:hypothetical protein
LAAGAHSAIALNGAVLDDDAMVGEAHLVDAIVQLTAAAAAQLHIAAPPTTELTACGRSNIALVTIAFELMRLWIDVAVDKGHLILSFRRWSVGAAEEAATWIRRRRLFFGIFLCLLF